MLALVAGPPSPLNPCTPFPASVRITPGTYVLEGDGARDALGGFDGVADTLAARARLPPSGAAAASSAAAASRHRAAEGAMCRGVGWVGRDWGGASVWRNS